MKDELEAQRGVPADRVEEDAILTQDLGLDSLDLVALRMEIESRYDVFIPDNELDSIVTIGDVVDRMLEKLNVGA